MIVNKATLVSEVATAQGITKKQAEDNMTALFDCIKKHLVDGDTINIIGSFKLGVRERSAREITNPMTGERQMTEPKKSVYIKGGKLLVDALNSK